MVNPRTCAAAVAAAAAVWTAHQYFAASRICKSFFIPACSTLQCEPAYSIDPLVRSQNLTALHVRMALFVPLSLSWVKFVPETFLFAFINRIC